MVEGLSKIEMAEWRRGIPTVDAGDGGRSLVSSRSSGVPDGASAMDEGRESFDAERPKCKVRDAERLSEDARSSMERRLR